MENIIYDKCFKNKLKTTYFTVFKVLFCKTVLLSVRWCQFFYHLTICNFVNTQIFPINVHITLVTVFLCFYICFRLLCQHAHKYNKLCIYVAMEKLICVQLLWWGASNDFAGVRVVFTLQHFPLNCQV